MRGAVSPEVALGNEILQKIRVVHHKNSIRLALVCKKINRCDLHR